MNTQIKDPQLKNLADKIEESFSSKVSVRNNFKKELRKNLTAQHKSNLVKNLKMEKNTKVGLKSILASLTSKTANIAIAGAGLLVVVVAGGAWYLTNNPLTAQKEKFGYLSTVEGKAVITRGEDTITVKVDSDNIELKEGDILKTEDDTIADAETIYGRVSLSSNTQVTLDGKDGDVSLESGTVYARTKDSKEIKINTSDGKITVENGATLTSISEETGTTAKSIAGKVAGSAASKESPVPGETPASEEEAKAVQSGMQVDIKDGVISEESEINRDDLKTPFCEHNKDKDEEQGYDTGTTKDLTPPELTIVSPEDKSTTEKTKTTVKAKSNEDGWANYNGKWNEIKADEDFTYEVSLKEGSNDIPVKIKDKSYNRTTKTLTVTYKSPVTINLDTVSAISTGIYLKWSASKIDSSYTYLVRRSTSSTASSTQNDLVSFTASSSTKEWVDTSTVKGTTYYYHVILLGSNNLEVKRSAIKGATAINEPPPPPPPDNTCKINLWIASKSTSSLLGRGLGCVNGGKVTLNWTISGDCPDFTGQKVVWSKSTDPDPVYPPTTGGHANYVSKDTRSHEITGLSEGTWKIRVGLYKNGQIVNNIYSNMVTATF